MYRPEAFLNEENVSKCTRAKVSGQGDQCNQAEGWQASLSAALQRERGGVNSLTVDSPNTECIVMSRMALDSKN